MKNYTKALALLLCFTVCAGFVFSMSLLSHGAVHGCPEEGCGLCSLAFQHKDLLPLMQGAVLFSVAIMLMTAAPGEDNCFSPKGLKTFRLVKEKVKITV